MMWFNYPGNSHDAFTSLSIAKDKHHSDKYAWLYDEIIAYDHQYNADNNYKNRYNLNDQEKQRLRLSGLS